MPCTVSLSIIYCLWSCLLHFFPLNFEVKASMVKKSNLRAIDMYMFSVQLNGCTCSFAAGQSYGQDKFSLSRILFCKHSLPLRSSGGCLIHVVMATQHHEILVATWKGDQPHIFLFTWKTQKERKHPCVSVHQATNSY